MADTKAYDIKWINIAKFVAIVAVLVDHTNGVLYTNQKIAMGSYFSVSLFIFLSGITIYISSSKYNDISAANLTWHRAKKIIIPYAVATFIYLVVATRRFEFVNYINYLINFNISGPFYFVLLYLQLILIAPILVKITNLIKNSKYCRWIYMATFLLTLVLAVWLTNNTNILNVYGGGGKLLGGTYLCLFYLGIICGKYTMDFEQDGSRNMYVVFGLSVIAWLLWWRFACWDRFALDTKLPFGGGFNPPSITLTVSALLMAIVCMSGTNIINRSNYRLGQKIARILNGGGENLCIFSCITDCF